MCGLIGFSGSYDHRSLATGLRSISHRGPDDHGIYLDSENGVGLGHNRLSILDLSPLGHQPMVDASGSVVLAYNGEVYNFRTLRKELEAAGHRFKGNSDTEVILALYLAEGVSFVSRLNGVFAFAIWDRRTKSMVLVRDGLGVKPMYVAETDLGVAFASEIKALLHLLPGARQLDVDALRRYLSFLWCPGAGTPLRSVKKLLPGEALLIRDGRITRRWCWYQLPVVRGVRADLTESDAVAGTAFHLRQAVERQMVADVPVGAFLSGGLDSSAVVAFAKAIDPDIRCFSIEMSGGQDEGLVDDLPFAKEAARHLGVRLEVVSIDAPGMAADLVSMVEQLDEPLADPACLNVLYISRLARQHGIKVLLSGAGGDDLFTGYRRHRAIQAERYWTWLPSAIRWLCDEAVHSLDQRNPLVRRAAKALSGAGLDGDGRIANYFAWSRRQDLLPLYTQEFVAQLRDEPPAQPFLDYLTMLPSGAPPLARLLGLEQRFFLGDHNLIYTDKMSMAAGVEVRVPFLDVDLVEFAQRVPLGLKQRGKEGKWVLKKAMEPYLPDSIIYRPKSGFGAPLRRWMRQELKPLVGDLLSADSLKRRGLFDFKAVQRLMDRHDRGQVDAAYTLFSLLCIEIWCRTYLDGKRVS